LKHDIRRREEIAAALLAQRVSSLGKRILAGLGLAADAVASAVVPSSDYGPTRLPRRWRNDFQRHLQRVVGESFRTIPDPASQALPLEETPSAPQFADESRAAKDGCSTCRGHCCRLGAVSHAFLDATTLHRYRTRRPRLTARQIVAAYMSRLPAQSVENSCVFHGAVGCTLPRHMRAAICNLYHCAGLERVQARADDPGVQRVVIMAASGSRVTRWRIHDTRAAGSRASMDVEFDERTVPADPITLGDQSHAGGEEPA
jgi:hypothetical protein